MPVPLLMAGLGALGGILGGRNANRQGQASWEQANYQDQLRRSDLERGFAFDQGALSGLAKYYADAYGDNPWAAALKGFDPSEVFNFGGRGWRLDYPDMPKFKGTPWWEGALGGAVGGISNYLNTRPALGGAPTGGSRDPDWLAAAYSPRGYSSSPNMGQFGNYRRSSARMFPG